MNSEYVYIVTDPFDKSKVIDVLTHYRPERSKREDLERKCKYCSKKYVVNISSHVCDECFPKVNKSSNFKSFPRCGALNSMET